MVDYDELTPFPQILHRTIRKRELRAFRRRAFDVGAGLDGVDHGLISMYFAGELHESRTMALDVRFAIDETFRAYAEPAIRLWQETARLSDEERLKHFEANHERVEALPKSPRDVLIAALAAQAITLSGINVTYDDADEDDYDEWRWPIGDDLDFELEQELDDEMRLPLDEECEFADATSEALGTAVRLYVAGELNARERRVVEARAMRDLAFGAEWGDVIATRMEKRVLSREKRRRRRSDRRE